MLKTGGRIEILKFWNFVKYCNRYTTYLRCHPVSCQAHCSAVQDSLMCNITDRDQDGGNHIIMSCNVIFFKQSKYISWPTGTFVH